MALYFSIFPKFLQGCMFSHSVMSITNSRSLLKLMSIESVIPSNHLILCRPLLLLSSIFPSIRVFSNESFLCIRWPKYWSFSFSISLPSEYSGLISFRMDWFGLHVVQGTLKSLCSYRNRKRQEVTLSLAFIVCRLFDDGHSDWCEIVPHCGFDLHFSNNE